MEGLERHVPHDLEPTNLGAAVGVTALHILNRLPTQIDPFEQGLSRIRQLAQRKMV